MFSNVDLAVVQEQKLLLHQADLHKSIRDGVLQLHNKLDGQMSTLPTDVREEVKGIVNVEFDQLRFSLYTDVQHAFRASLRTMVASMVGEHLDDDRQQQQQGGSMSPACCQRVQDVSYSGIGLPQRSHLCIERYVPSQSARGSVPWIWNDQTSATNRLPQRRVD